MDRIMMSIYAEINCCDGVRKCNSCLYDTYRVEVYYMFKELPFNGVDIINEVDEVDEENYTDY